MEDTRKETKLTKTSMKLKFKIREKIMKYVVNVSGHNSVETFIPEKKQQQKSEI